jgi:hypothetical protein
VLYALSWFAVIALLALWSLAIWAAHAAAVWTVTQAADLSRPDAAFEGWQLPDPLAAGLPPDWLRAMESALAGLGPLVDRLLQSVPVLAEVLGIVSWLAWGLGAVLILGLGAGLHLLVALWRRRAAGTGTHRGPTLSSGPSAALH